jgi:hypothetical protein
MKRGEIQQGVAVNKGINLLESRYPCTNLEIYCFLKGKTVEKRGTSDGGRIIDRQGLRLR